MYRSRVYVRELTRLFGFSNRWCSGLPRRSQYDVVVIGAGHNGLIAAAYLAKAGKSVCVLEKRHIVGGAAVTEEIVPGFKFSRASYVLSLLRPVIYKDLDLYKHGLHVYVRDPNSFTPVLQPNQIGANYLLLGRSSKSNHAEISKFSTRDAEQYTKYESLMTEIAQSITYLLDEPPMNVKRLLSGGWREVYRQRSAIRAFSNMSKALGPNLLEFYRLMTSSTSKLLDIWFESEPLKATLATDAVIGASQSPYHPTSGYVLLHHVMGEVNGIKGAWGYVRGGMGALSDVLCKAAQSHGVHIQTNKNVTCINTDKSGVKSVVTDDGVEIQTPCVFSNCTPHVTFNNFLPKGALSEEESNKLSQYSYASPVTKLNVALSRIPRFTATDDTTNDVKGHHCGTIHLNSDSMDIIHSGYLDFEKGIPSKKPVIEMTIPTSVDDSLAAPSAHVAQLFTQYTPYHIEGRPWTAEDRESYANTVFSDIESYAPGFKESIVGYEVLTPMDLESVFGLTGGNIFHGAMSFDQLYFMRPIEEFCEYQTSVNGLYLCGSSTHPGGGVMGSCGRLAALAYLSNTKKKSGNRTRS